VLPLHPLCPIRLRPPPRPPLFPYTTLFRSAAPALPPRRGRPARPPRPLPGRAGGDPRGGNRGDHITGGPSRDLQRDQPRSGSRRRRRLCPPGAQHRALSPADGSRRATTQCVHSSIRRRPVPHVHSSSACAARRPRSEEHCARLTAPPPLGAVRPVLPARPEHVLLGDADPGGP